MSIKSTTIFVYVCNKCGHDWTNRADKRGEIPRACPKCKCVTWNDDVVEKQEES